MKRIFIIIFLFFISGCTSSTALVKSCNELDGKNMWVKIEKPAGVSTHVYPDQEEVWLKNQDGKIARCLSCEGSKKEAAVFNYIEDKKEVDSIVTTCGPY